MRVREKNKSHIKIICNLLELTTAVLRVTEPELQAGGRRTLLRAIRRTEKQPKILLYMI